MGIVMFLVENSVVITGGLLAASELLALSPKVKANSVFQACVNGLAKLKELAVKAKG